jgi:hypothetical protein
MARTKRVAHCVIASSVGHQRPSNGSTAEQGKTMKLDAVKGQHETL